MPIQKDELPRRQWWPRGRSELEGLGLLPGVLGVAYEHKN